MKIFSVEIESVIPKKLNTLTIKFTQGTRNTERMNLEKPTGYFIKVIYNVFIN